MSILCKINIYLAQFPWELQLSRSCSILIGRPNYKKAIDQHSLSVACDPLWGSVSTLIKLLLTTRQRWVSYGRQARQTSPMDRIASHLALGINWLCINHPSMTYTNIRLPPNIAQCCPFSPRAEAGGQRSPQLPRNPSIWRKTRISGLFIWFN